MAEKKRKRLNINDYIYEVIKDLDLSEMLIGKIRDDLEKELKAKVAAGMTEYEATDERGYPELVAIELMKKYDKKTQEKRSSEGKLPMMFWWGLMFSSLLFSIKGIVWLWVEPTAFDKLGCIAGLAGLAACGIYAVIWKKKQAEAEAAWKERVAASKNKKVR